MFVLSLPAGDLGLRMARGCGKEVVVLTGLVREESASLLGKDGMEVALVRTKEGLDESFPKLSVPLDRLEKRTGSTFSESSRSTKSAAFRLRGAGEAIAAGRLAQGLRIGAEMGEDEIGCVVEE
jgi:hypothetical protein